MHRMVEYKVVSCIKKRYMLYYPRGAKNMIPLQCNMPVHNDCSTFSVYGNHVIGSDDRDVFQKATWP